MDIFSYNVDIICFLHKKEDVDMGRDIVLAKIKKGGITEIVGGGVNADFRIDHNRCDVR